METRIHSVDDLLMNIGQLGIMLPLKGKQALVQNTMLNMLVIFLYKEGHNGIVCLCVESSNKVHYLKTTHVVVGNQTLKKALYIGVWQPTIKQEVQKYVW